jgi:hypothetical protein
VILAVVAAPADHPAARSALAKLPDKANEAAEPTASRNPATGIARVATGISTSVNRLNPS